MSFNFPREYNFPPFFTIQPNLEIQRVQLESWRSLILDFCQHEGIHKLCLRDWLNKPPFSNETINRRLDIGTLKTIIDSLVAKRFAEWVDGKNKETCLIYARPPDQWAQIIYDYVKEKALQNTIVTFYEMLEDDSTKKYEFHQLDELIFLKALRILEKSGKCSVIEMNGSKGVKFV